MHMQLGGEGTPRPGWYQARKRRARDHGKQKIQEPGATGSAARGQQLPLTLANSAPSGSQGTSASLLAWGSPLPPVAPGGPIHTEKEP